MNYGPEFIAALVPELRQRCGCQLQHIDAGGDWCVFSFRSRKPLFFTWNPETFGICDVSPDDVRELRSQSIKTPFAMGLQRHLGGSSMTGAECIEGDRVILCRFQRFIGGGVSKEFTLVLELTGRMSNALFTDDKGVILEAAKHVYPDSNRYRSVIPGAPYTPPPPIAGIFPRADMDDTELAACLQHPRGVGRPVATELLRLWNAGFSSLVRDALFGEPKIFQRLGKYLTALGTRLPSSVDCSGDGLAFSKAFIAAEIERRSLKNIAARALKILDRQRGRRVKHADGLRSQIEKAKNCDSYRTAGEALLQNLGTLKGRQASVTLKYWDAEGEKTVDVALNPALDLQGNAKYYFKKYQKYRTDVAAVRAQLDVLLAELADIAALESNLRRVQSAEKLTELCRQIEEQYVPDRNKKQPRKVKKPLPPHLRFALGSSVILVGMNERGNRYVTFQEASPEDLWFHVHEFPGSHVILKNPPGDPGEFERAVRAAASLALCYSECDSGSSVIDYTEKKHVRHIAGGGPANVTYKLPRTVLVAPDDWEEILRRL